MMAPNGSLVAAALWIISLSTVLLLTVDGEVPKEESGQILYMLSRQYNTQSSGIGKLGGKGKGKKTTPNPSEPQIEAEGNGTKKKMSEQEIITKVLKGYDWRVRPYGQNDSAGDTGGPVIVNVNFLLRSISKISDVSMEYSTQFTFREQWTDPRLAYQLLFPNRPMPEFVVLTTGDSAQQIWMPDTFFQNEKEARKHNIDKPNVLVRIYKDGRILYSVRLSLVFSCPMLLQYYPLDTQTCLIDLASYAYTTDDIKYEWKAENPVQLKVGLHKSLPSFNLVKFETGYCTSKTNTGEYSCLRTELILKREYSYYLLQLYIPSCMLVIVSWVSFWLDKDAVPARVALGVTTLLTMTTQASGVNAKLPPVSYTKAVDVWIGACLAFIFGALLEFALVNYNGRLEFLRKQKRSNNANNASLQPMNSLQPAMGVAVDMSRDYNKSYQRPPQPRRPNRCRIWLSKYQERSKQIDVISRVFFPLFFFLFNIVYWTVYIK